MTFLKMVLKIGFKIDPIEIEQKSSDFWCFWTQPLSEAFQNVDGKGFLKEVFERGTACASGAVRALASTLWKVLLQIEQILFKQQRIFMHFGNCYERVK